MRVAVYSSKSYDRDYLDRANADGRYAFTYLESRLDLDSAAGRAGFRRCACSSTTAPTPWCWNSWQRKACA